MENHATNGTPGETRTSAPAQAQVKKKRTRNRNKKTKQTPTTSESPTQGSHKNSNGRSKNVGRSKKHGAAVHNDNSNETANHDCAAQEHHPKPKNGKTNHKRNSSRNSSSSRKSNASKTSQPAKKNANAEKNNTEKTNNKQDLLPYPAHYTYQDCVARYAAKDPSLIKGRFRALNGQKDGGSMGFVTCDRGSLARDVLLETKRDQNRALDGDVVFVEVYPQQEENVAQKNSTEESSVCNEVATLSLKESESTAATWQDDAVQRCLWNPLVRVRKVTTSPPALSATTEEPTQQAKGRVVFVMPPNTTPGTQPSELNPSDTSYRSKVPRRAIVGTLKKRGSSGYLFVPNNKALPQFFCKGRVDHGDKSQGKDSKTAFLYKAEYVYGSWSEVNYWPPCEHVQCMGTSCNVEDETMALLTENGVDHGDFTAPVFEDVNKAVESGLFAQTSQQRQSNDKAVARQEDNLGWKPTPEMYKGRRDYRKQRIFTIDPTTAKDLDDALHVTQLPDGRVEIGVHIADVSHFVQPETFVDQEAQRRATTVYLVDRTVPMLPRPLCEVACSLNENVERLAFSCVWRMNMDGTLERKSGNQKGQTDDDVWYGKTVIKSCARLDYATAQNIIEDKVATGESARDLDETLWPRSRQPTGGHTIDQVAADVRLMNRVAQARRRLRFQNGALALNGVKLAFQLEDDGETPMLCAPYPIRDSNRLVEEYMLLANYLVAQRLISHTGGLALLRQHPPPLPLGLDKVVTVAKEGMGFDIDSSSSQALQETLSRLGRECQDELVLQCVTEMLMAPMQQAEYIAAGEVGEEYWRHFALNIPYYTHFTSPIRRYADVVVHRLLQATIEGQDAVDAFPLQQKEIHSICAHCNEKKMASKKAQDRSDRVFLALYLRRNPLRSQKGVVLSVGIKTFFVFVPSLGLSTLVYLDEHKGKLEFEPYTTSGDERRIRIGNKKKTSMSWSRFDIKVFTTLCVTCTCNEKPPIDVKVMMEGPWEGDK